MSKKYNSFVGHNDAVTCLQWSNYKETQFASGSADRKIVVWDVSQIGSEMTEQQKQQQNKTDEIGFIHGGHRSRVTDFCYAEEHNLIGSCEENNMLQVWQMSESLNGKK
jgi:histone-binding protein RBBP4